MNARRVIVNRGPAALAYHSRDPLVGNRCDGCHN